MANESAFRGSGKIGLPPAVKEGGKRVDFKALNSEFDTDFDFLLETKCPRFGWARAALCPCVGFNDQTEQADPSCAICNGLGWHYFEPTDYVRRDDLIGELDDAQCALLDKAHAVVIKALLTGASSQPNMFATLGNWALGSSMASVRPGNRLGYYDRLISLDDEMVYSELLDTDGTDTLPLRYPAVVLNFVRSIDKVYTDDDLYLDAGVIKWRTNKEPAADTKISVHYVCRPVWVVIEHTKLNRTSLVSLKQTKKETPQGNILHLPPQVLVRLEHLPLDPNS